jgi:hypothetical protein
MKDPRWTSVDGLFEAALERQRDERAALLRDACSATRRCARRSNRCSRIYLPQAVEQPDSDVLHIRMGWESAAASAK